MCPSEGAVILMDQQMQLPVAALCLFCLLWCFAPLVLPPPLLLQAWDGWSDAEQRKTCRTGTMRWEKRRCLCWNLAGRNWLPSEDHHDLSFSIPALPAMFPVNELAHRQFSVFSRKGVSGKLLKKQLVDLSCRKKYSVLLWNFGTKLQ